MMDQIVCAGTKSSLEMQVEEVEEVEELREEVVERTGRKDAGVQGRGALGLGPGQEKKMPQRWGMMLKKVGGAWAEGGRDGERGVGESLLSGFRFRVLT